MPILNCSLSATYVIVKKMKVKRRRYVHALAPTAGIIADKDIKKQIILSHCTKVTLYFFILSFWLRVGAFQKENSKYYLGIRRK